MLDINDIKKLKEKNNTAALNEAFETEDKKSESSDERFWKLDFDDKGKGKAIIRFLPAMEENKTPWIKLVKHKVFNRVSGQYYNELSLTMLGKKDPVDEINKRHYKNGDKTEAAKYGRRIEFVSNILVVKDEKNPDNEGKVFLFAYGKKIFDIIKDTCIPVMEEDEAVNIFDVFEGADFFYISKDNGPDRYASSKFKKQTPISKDNDEIVRICNDMYDLSSLTTPENFRTYEQLQDRINEVMGVGVNNTEYEMPEEDENEEEKE